MKLLDELRAEGLYRSAQVTVLCWLVVDGKVFPWEEVETDDGWILVEVGTSGGLYELACRGEQWKAGDEREVKMGSTIFRLVDDPELGRCLEYTEVEVDLNLEGAEPFDLSRGYRLQPGEEIEGEFRHVAFFLSEEEAKKFVADNPR